MNDYANPVGTSMPRLETREKITGSARYTDDMTLPGMLYGAVLGSPYAHARILSYDTTAAEAMDGVAAVLTGDDIGLDRIGPFIKDDFAIAKGKVRYVGEPVALVAAEDRYLAEDAIEAIEVDYDGLREAEDTELRLFDIR